MTREEWLAWFENASMAEVVSELDDYINSDEFKEACRKHLVDIGAIPKGEGGEIDPSIMLDLSYGKVSLMEATHLLGFQDAGYTLQLMAKVGLPMRGLSEETVKRQTAETLRALQECSLPAKPEKDAAE